MQSNNTSNIEGIQASLRYLSLEAEGAGLSGVASMLEQAALKCDEERQEGNEPTTADGGELVRAINFLYHYHKASKSSQKMFIQQIQG